MACVKHIVLANRIKLFLVGFNFSRRWMSFIEDIYRGKYAFYTINILVGNHESNLFRLVVI